MLYQGCVEDRNDPLMIGRCRVRIVGVHTHDKIELPTEDLPWAHPLGPITSASMNGLGWSPTGIVQGTWVVVDFLDEYQQQPVILGTIGGIPHTQSAIQASLSYETPITTNYDGDIVDPLGNVLTDIITALSTADTTSNEPPIAKSTEFSIVPERVESSEGIVTNLIIYQNNTETNTKKIATAYYQKDRGTYSTNLVDSDTWTAKQLEPFKSGPLQFKNPDEILKFFEEKYSTKVTNNGG